MSQELSVTEAARNLSKVVNRVIQTGSSVDLTRDHKVVARLVPAETTNAPTGAQVAEMWKSISSLTDTAE